MNRGYLPDRIVAGETIVASGIAPDSLTPAGGYTLSYLFASPTPSSVSAVAADDGLSWTLTVPAATTLTWRAPGLRYAGMLTEASTGRVAAVDDGYVAVEPSPIAVSQYAAALAAVETAIANYATSPARSLTIGSMSFAFNSPAELIEIRNFLRGEVARETGKRQRRIIRTRFA